MRLIFIAVAIMFAVYLALPSFFLKKAIGKETLDAVTERLGAPLLTTPKPGTTTVINTYRFGIQPPVCVDYVITFELKALSEDAPLKPIVSAWDWKFCGLP